MEQTQLATPLSNMQVELLQLFTRNVDESDLLAMKRMIVKYLAQKVTKLADNVWNEKKLTVNDMEELLNNQERTPYNPA